MALLAPERNGNIEIVPLSVPFYLRIGESPENEPESIGSQNPAPLIFPPLEVAGRGCVLQGEKTVFPF